MKFENIKIGDKVLVEKTIRYGWGNDRSFLIYESVEKITKTQFSTKEGNRFKKENGKHIGKGYGVYCYLEGDSYGYSRNLKAKNQVLELDDFIECLRLERSIIKEMESLNLKLGSGIDLVNLSLIKKDLLALKKSITQSSKPQE